MTNANPTPLKQALYDAYDGFADRRIKNLERGDTFIVDDRGRGDFGADKSLFGWFVQIFLQVIDADTVKLSFRGELPSSKATEDWFDKHFAEDTNFGREVLVKFGTQADLTALGDAIAAVVAPGTRYPVKAWKYVAPRTAGALRRVDRVLTQAWAAT
ncbi:hypothetical protein [Caulobacter sp. LARHSG274]